MKFYKHILVAADLSEENETVFLKAKQFADLMEAKLELLHVVEPLANYGFIGITEVENDLIEQAKQQLADVGKKIDVPINQQWVALGSAKREILSAAKELGVDLIIMGSHTGLHFSDILGSTTNAVLHRAECDVLTIRYKSE